MTDEELIKQLLCFDSISDVPDVAADRIKQLQLELDNERQYQVSMEYLWALDRELLSNLKEHSENTEAKLAKAVEALKSLHHVVCGETGFASAVRNHSGKAYPWEPLDIADAQTRAVLAELEGGK